MPTLAELRAEPVKDDRPKATVTVTLLEGQHLLEEARKLDDERVDLLVQAKRRKQAAEDGKAGPVKPAEGGGAADRLEEIQARHAELQDQLAAFQGEVSLVGFKPGEWQRYKDDHPPRDASRDDKVVASGWCNATDLLNDLARFVTAWDGDTLLEGEWDGSISTKVTPADFPELVREVVAMHQSRIPRLPKAKTSPATGSDATG